MTAVLAASRHYELNWNSPFQNDFRFWQVELYGHQSLRSSVTSVPGHFEPSVEGPTCPSTEVTGDRGDRWFHLFLGQFGPRVVPCCNGNIPKRRSRTKLAERFIEDTPTTKVGLSSFLRRGRRRPSEFRPRDFASNRVLKRLNVGWRKQCCMIAQGL